MDEIRRLNQGVPSSSAQIPYYDAQNGQGRRASVGALAEAVGLLLNTPGAIPGASLVISTDGFPDDATGYDGWLAVDPATGAVYKKAAGSWALLSAGAAVVALAVSGTPVLSTTEGEPYAGFLMVASGGVPPYSYSDPANSLPAGLSVHPTVGLVHGTSTQVGSSGLVALVANDSRGAQAVLTPFSITTVAAGSPLAISGSPPQAVVGVAYNWMPTVTGGAGPRSFSLTAGTLPDGLSVDGSAGVVGTPASTQTATGLEITVTDSTGSAALGPFSLAVIANVTVPGAPTIGAATAGNGSVSVAFMPPAPNGGPSVLDYQVLLSTGQTATGSSSPIVVTAPNGVPVTATVRARNSDGYGPPSAASNSVTPSSSATAPGAPTGLSGTAGNAQIAFSATAPSSNGGAAIDQYRVTLSPGGATFTGSTPNITATGLTNGQAYTATMAARNSVGYGPESTASSAVTPSSGSEVAPVIYNADKIRSMLDALAGAGSSRAALAFHGHSIVKGIGSNLPAGTTGATATETLADAQLWRTQSMGPRIAEALSSAVGGVAGRGVEVPSVGQALQFTLGGSAAISPIYSPGGAHGRVWNLSASTDWIQFSAQGPNVRVFGYALASGVSARYQINGGSVQTAAASGSELTGTGAAVWYEFNITGLTAGDTVRVLGPTSSGVRISGVDFDHKTGAGVTVHRIAEGDKMGCQVVATYLDSTDTQPAGGWLQADPAGTNVRNAQATSVTTRLGIVGALNMFDVNDIKGYNYAGQAWGWTLPVLERHLKNYLTWMAAQNLPVLLVLGPYRNPDIANTAGTPYTQQDIIDLYKSISDWSTNCAYIDLTDEFQVGATAQEKYAYQQSFAYHMDGVHPNAGGALHYAQRIAAAIAAVPAATVPGAPTIGTATAGSGVANIAFTAPADNGGAPILEYQALLSNSNTATGSASPIAVASTNGVAVTGRVRARNSAGWGGYSGNSNSVTPSAAVTTPGAPTIGTATAGDGTVTVTFTAPASDGGASITGYRVTLSDGKTATGSASPITVTGATNGSPVTATVQAQNSQGYGAASAASNSVTPAAITGPGDAMVMSPLVNLTSQPGNNYLAASGLASYGANGRPGSLGIPADGEGWTAFRIGATSLAGVSMGLYTTDSANAASTALCAVTISVAQQKVYRSAGAVAGASITEIEALIPVGAGNFYRLHRTALGVYTIQKTTDGGTTWTTIYTFTGVTTTAKVYPVLMCNSDATIYNPRMGGLA